MFLFFFSLKRKFHWTGNGLVISVQKKFIETLREAVVLFLGGGQCSLVENRGPFALIIVLSGELVA
jgi:hypothetical protein